LSFECFFHFIFKILFISLIQNIDEFQPTCRTWLCVHANEYHRGSKRIEKVGAGLLKHKINIEHLECQRWQTLNAHKRRLLSSSWYRHYYVCCCVYLFVCDFFDCGSRICVELRNQWWREVEKNDTVGETIIGSRCSLMLLRSFLKAHNSSLSLSRPRESLLRFTVHFSGHCFRISFFI